MKIDSYESAMSPNMKLFLIHRHVTDEFFFFFFRYYQVIVRELAKDNKGNPVPPYDPDSYKTEDLYTYDEARRMKPKLVPYIAFQFSASDFDRFKRFTVGDGKGSFDTELKSFLRRRRRSNGGSVYYNGPLEEQTLYTVFQRAYVNKVGIKAFPCSPSIFKITVILL